MVIGGILAVGWSLQGRQYGTPLWGSRTLLKYPLPYHEEFERDCKFWNVDVGVIGYARSSDRAYGNHNGTHKVDFSTLLFNTSDFTLAEAFPNGKIPTPFPNPFVLVSTLAPRLDYDEAGAVFTADAHSNFCWCGQTIHAGVRARLPIRDVTVRHREGPDGGSATGGLTLGDVFMERFEGGAPTVTNGVQVYAARLDFLSALTWKYPNNLAHPGIPLVNYHNSSAADHVTIGSQSVDTAVNVSSGEPAVALVGRADGTMPVDQTWGQPPATTDPILNADGTGVGTNTRGYFAFPTDYTPLASNTAAQKTLFVVPTLNALGGVNAGVMGAIEQAVMPYRYGGSSASVQGFLTANGLDFYDGRSQGLGDMDIEAYLGTMWGCDNRWWTDIMLGVTPPTGKKLNTSNNLIMLAPGNNGHTEIFAGAAGGWDALYWLKLMIDGTYTWVLKHHEKVAAAFKGATVKNIGPSLDAEVKWSYLVGHAMLSFYAYDCASFDVGYELYYKRPDRITFDQTTATDLAGTPNQALDSSVVEKYTKRIAHKLRGGLLLKTGTWEVAGCVSYVVAGKNIPREFEWDLRLGLTF